MVDGLTTRESPKRVSVLNGFLANGTLANDSLRFVDWYGIDRIGLPLIDRVKEHSSEVG